VKHANLFSLTYLTYLSMNDETALETLHFICALQASQGARRDLPGVFFCTFPAAEIKRRKTQ
jgi:hypothetical protein